MRSKPYFGSRTAWSDSPVCAPTSRKTFTRRQGTAAVRAPSRAQAPKKTNAGATGRAKRGSAKRPSAFSTITRRAETEIAVSVRQPRGRRRSNATRPSTIQRTGRGNQRESWLKRSSNQRFGRRSGSAAKSASLSRTILSKRGFWLGSLKTKWWCVADVHTSRMLSSGRRIQRFCPAGIGSPSVRAGMRPHRLDTGLAQHGVVAVPPEDLVGQDVEILVDAEAAAREDLVERHAVGLVRIAREQMALDRVGESARGGAVVGGHDPVRDEGAIEGDHGVAAAGERVVAEAGAVQNGPGGKWEDRRGHEGSGPRRPPPPGAGKNEREHEEGEQHGIPGPEDRKSVV